MKPWTIAALCLWVTVLGPRLPLAAAAPVLMMATTTSTDNTGLLDVLAAAFKRATAIELRWTATGTGKALKLGENCDVDILIVHAPAAEKRFVDAGYGSLRREVMVNDFVIVGPHGDPAAVAGKSIREALTALHAGAVLFASRGDQSGTHKKELSLWSTAGLTLPDREHWYSQTGQGMLSTLHVAAERQGYTLTDRGTFIKYEETQKGHAPLKILVEGDPDLLNQYSVIAVNPDHCANVKTDLAEAFIDWITGADGQRLIGDFKLLGRPLFSPNAKP